MTQKIWIFFDKQVIQIISAILILGVAECTVKLSSTLQYRAINCRKHSAVLTEFGAVGDGKTSNTKAFKAAIDSLSKYASDGGAQLIVPPGKWLTGSFSLTSHFTLFLHKDALILASQVRMTFFPHRIIFPLFVDYMFMILSLATNIHDQMDRMNQNGLKFLLCLLMGEHLVDGSAVLFLVQISQTS